MFEIGGQVVCIQKVQGFHDPHGQSWIVGDEPAVGSIYTVVNFSEYTCSCCDQFYTLLLLAEISCAIRMLDGSEYVGGYNAINFRPVRKTCIDVFTQMLMPMSPKRLEPIAMFK